MLVSVARSQRSCQAKPFWGFGMSRSCFFSPMWEFVRAQFKAPKLYTPPANHSATALLSTCRSHVTSSRMKDSTRTDEGQPDSCHLSSKTTVLSITWCLRFGPADTTNRCFIWLKSWRWICFQQFSSVFSWSALHVVYLLWDAERAKSGCSVRSSLKGRWTRERFSLKQRLREYISVFRHDWVHEEISTAASSRTQDKVMRQQKMASGKEKTPLWRDLSCSDHSGYHIFPLPFHVSSWLPWGCLQSHTCQLNPRHRTQNVIPWMFNIKNAYSERKESVKCPLV